MKIGIIGAGNVGQALARAWSKAGHDIIIGVRDAAKAKDIATQTNAQLVAPADVKLADVIVLATPWGVSADVLRSLGDMSGRTIIDCTNPLGMVNGQLGLTLGHTTSGAEELAKLVPDAHLVKTLNQVGAEVMDAAHSMDIQPVMFMASDHESAKATVASLLRDIGFDALDAGDLSKARLLEPFGMVWINQALFRDKGRKWAFAARDLPA